MTKWKTTNKTDHMSEGQQPVLNESTLFDLVLGAENKFHLSFSSLGVK